MIKILNLKKAALAAALTTASASSFADIPAAASSALTAASTDGASMAGIVLGVIVVIASVKYLRKAV
jgi:hypothetical protein